MPPMTRKLRAGGSLSTDPSATEQQENFRVADNVLLHRPGVVQPRLGFGDTNGIDTLGRGSDYLPLHVIPFAGDLVVQTYSSAVGLHRLERGSPTTVYNWGGTMNDSGVNPRVASFEARGSLYVPTAGDPTDGGGMLKLTSPGTSFIAAGVWQTYQPLSYTLTAASASDDRQAIGTAKCVGYRYVVRRTDANGYIARGAPSARVVVRVPTATFANGARATLGTIDLPEESRAGDVIELYRTRNASPDTADPGEDYFLVATHEITSAEISATQVGAVFVDDAEDAQLGATMYASASQGGIESAKEQPPRACVLSHWKSCAWAGNLFLRNALNVWLQQVAFRNGGTVRLEGVGLCYLDNGSYAGVSGNSLTGVTFSAGMDWDAVAVGQWITDSAVPGSTLGRIPAGAKITAFDQGAQTITLDQTPSSSGVFVCGDIITVGAEAGFTQDFYAYGSELRSARAFLCDQSSAVLNDRCRLTAESFCRVVGYQAVQENVWEYAYKSSEGRSWHVTTGDVHRIVMGDGAISGGGEISLVEKTPRGGAVQIQCATRGAAFAPNLSTAYSVEDSRKRGALAWSSIGEPEAWPLLNLQGVGDVNEDVLAFTPMTHSMLVWKTDGLYRISGDPPSSWAVECVDPKLRLLHANAVAMLNDVAYAWTDRGVVVVSSAGPQIISHPISDALRDVQRWLLETGDQRHAFWMAADPRLNRVVLSVGGGTDRLVAEDGSPIVTEAGEYIILGLSNTSTQQYVYHASTNRWSRNTLSSRCMAYDPVRGAFVHAPADSTSWSLVYERNEEDAADSYRDRSFLNLACTFGASNVTIAISLFDGLVPAAGDVIEGPAGTTRRVTSVAVVSTDYVLTLDASGSGSTCSWYQAIRSSVGWQAQSLPAQSMRWFEWQARFQEFVSAYASDVRIVYGGVSDTATPSGSVTATVPTQSVYGSESIVSRVGPPRALVRTTELYPSIAIADAGVWWALTQLDLLATAPQAQRITR